MKNEALALKKKIFFRIKHIGLLWEKLALLFVGNKNDRSEQELRKDKSAKKDLNLNQP